MSTTRVLALALLLSSPVIAFAQTYKCRQADGSLTYQDHACQVGASSTTIANIPSTASKVVPTPTYQDKLRDSERLHIAEETRAQNEQAQTYNRGLRCNEARQQLGLLREQRPVYRRSNTGERQYVDDKDRPKEILAAQQTVSDECR